MIVGAEGFSELPDIEEPADRLIITRPSKCLYNLYGTSHFLMGNINGPFSIAMLVYHITMENHIFLKDNGKPQYKWAIFHSYVNVYQRVCIILIIPGNEEMSCSYQPCYVAPSGYVKIAIEHGHRNSGFSHETWWIFPY